MGYLSEAFLAASQVRCTKKHPLHRHTSTVTPTHIICCTVTHNLLHRHTSSVTPAHIISYTTQTLPVSRHTSASPTSLKHTIRYTHTYHPLADTHHPLHRHTSSVAPTHIIRYTDTHHPLHRNTSFVTTETHHPLYPNKTLYRKGFFRNGSL